MRSNYFSRRLGSAICLLTVCATAYSPVRAQTADGDWPMYSLDLGGSRFSPLADLTPRNVGRLAEAWTAPVARGADDDSDAPGGRGNPQATPIVVDGVLYLPVRGNEVVAL
jgi:quinoprotein glucose dehydrogenase